MRIAIVTGASSGLGREFVRQLDQWPKLDEIWVIARREQRLLELQGQVRTPLRVLPLDLTEPRSLDRLQELLELERPRVQVLVNAAGFGRIGPSAGVSRRDCGRMIDLNCRAAVELTQLALPHLRRGSRVVQVCSTSAFQPFPYLNLYAATKALLYRYSRALHWELHGQGIAVTAVCPYWVTDTEFIPKAKEWEGDFIRSFPFAGREREVVRRALADARRGRAVSTPGLPCTLHRAVAKVSPASLAMLGWELLRRI